MAGQAIRPQDEAKASGHALYQTLSSGGRAPKTLVISCLLSRLEPAWMRGGDPDTLMVCRNIGGMAPAFGGEDESVAATVEYAVLAMGVREIVVAGFVDCEAIPTALPGEDPSVSHRVAAWLSHADAAVEAVASRQPDLDERGRLRALAMANIALQLNHLRSHPSVSRSFAEGGLRLHGWCLETDGSVLILDNETGYFTPFEVKEPDRA